MPHKSSTSSKYSNISTTSAASSTNNNEPDLGNSAENRTVTLKARVSDVEQIEKAVFGLMNTIGYITKEKDIYFNVTNGQLKLRLTKNVPHQKVAYMYTFSYIININ